MRTAYVFVALFIALTIAPAVATAQINFPKTGYLAALGDSVAAGDGALPVTNGYAYDLYTRGIFGKMQETEFSNAALGGVTILVSNYYSIPHPIPIVAAQLDAALQGFDQALRFWLQFVHVPAGSRVAVVDLYTPSLDRQGLVTIERRLGIAGPLDFDVHPTNVGHAFIAKQFERTWNGLN
jgi:hypothetical protein